MKQYLMAGLLAVAPAASVSASSLSQFLGKAEALQAKGVTAVFSGDYKLLQDEVLRSLFLLRDERMAAKAAGKAQAYCPPAGGPTLSNDEILDAMRAVPPNQRDRLEVKDALRPLLTKKYPCR